NDDGNFVITTDRTRMRRYLNRARCGCAEAAPNAPASIFKTRLTLPDPTVQSQQASLEVGTNCADVDPLLRRCEQVDVIEDILNLRRGVDYDIPVDQFMFPNEACAP